VTVSRVFLESGADRILIAGTECRAEELFHWSLRDRTTGADYAFHPNMAMIRSLNLQRRWRDVFIDATALIPGDHVLDCTLGFAGEAALASIVVGEGGRVVGLESVPELALVTRAGASGSMVHPLALRQALRRVEVLTADYRTFLPACPARSFDVVYFDPFFGDRLPGSENSVSPLAVFGNTSALDVTSVHEARRVARKRVVVKSPRREDVSTEIEEMSNDVVTGRKSRVVYYVIHAFGPGLPRE
jgi:16S rRNA (guanine1516-N2)-methyltransferase